MTEIYSKIEYPVVSGRHSDPVADAVRKHNVNQQIDGYVDKPFFYNDLNVYLPEF